MRIGARVSACEGSKLQGLEGCSLGEYMYIYLSEKTVEEIRSLQNDAGTLFRLIPQIVQLKPEYFLMATEEKTSEGHTFYHGPQSDPENVHRCKDHLVVFTKSCTMVTVNERMYGVGWHGIRPEKDGVIYTARTIIPFRSICEEVDPIWKQYIERAAEATILAR